MVNRGLHVLDGDSGSGRIAAGKELFSELVEKQYRKPLTGAGRRYRPQLVTPSCRSAAFRSTLAFQISANVDVEQLLLRR